MAPFELRKPNVEHQIFKRMSSLMASSSPVSFPLVYAFPPIGLLRRVSQWPTTKRKS